jgi:diguanylate cyclase (GGDEF)-like protein
LNKRLAVLCVDLDHFGDMQDSLGYRVADELLKEVGNRLVSCVPDEEDVAHVGEDVFFLLLEEVDSPDVVATFADHIRDEISAPMELNGESTIVSASVGIAMYPDDEAEEHGLMRAADIAMCRAREEGRDRYAFFTRAMHAAVKEKVAMRNGLRNAERRSEFLLHYQPQVDVPTGRVTGVEALLRWSHPGEGILPPARFLSYIEESDQILSVGGWVLEEACHTHCYWRDNGFPGVRVSVNLSGRQLNHETIVEQVKKVVEEKVMDPSDLVIEITERVLSNGSSQILKNLSGLRSLGVRMAIDDFGTGYSSLSSLKRFPVDVLKLDRSFVSDLPSNGRGEALIESVIEMAHRLDLEVVAEGVETQEQLKLLSGLGCNQIQGFLFSKPLSQDNFEDLLRRNRA